MAKTVEKKPVDTFIASLLAKYPQFFDAILNKKDELKIQIIYSQIDREKKGKIKFTDHSFNLDPDNYYYPASTVKLPVAILALQKLNELKIPGLDKNTTMITGTDGDGQTGVSNDPSSSNGRPSMAHYIKKILLVSDNDAFNRLYEFLGQEYINNSLHRMGYTDVQIIHRLNISLPEDQNRHTNPVEFYDDNDMIIYKKPAEKSKLVHADRNTKIGKGYYKGDSLINEPFNFSKKNRLSLQDLHHIVRAVMFPEAVPEMQRFNLTDDDYVFLRKYMSMMPPESTFPLYAPPDYWDTYVKFLLYGAEKNKAEPTIRIFNKPGDAYGFMIDAAYIADYKNKIEFQLSAVIYCNSDGILNDDKYDYAGVGLPFMKNLGRVIYEYELSRKRKKIPDLSLFQYSYKD
ncbi:MAG TPA: serine hydrolase [Chitinophagaceae bacterium]|nr:serine hydrolase [Chitinophagaceae bacterium]